MAKLNSGTRIFGTATVDSTLVVGNTASSNSTSNSTGSLVVTGGVGITGNVYANAMYDSNTRIITVAQNAYGVANNALPNTGALITVNTSSQLYVSNTTASRSNITGSLIVSGGVGITGNLFMSGSANIVAKGVLTDDMLSIDTVGYGVTTTGLNAINVRYQGGAAAIEGGAIRVDSIPGTTAGGTWNSYRVLQSTGAATGVTVNGIKFDPVSTLGGINNMIYGGTGWDNIISINGTSFINGNGAIKLINGTTTEAPIVFANANGSLLLTNASSGSLEYDGSSLYITSANISNGSGRMIINSSQFANVLTSAAVTSGSQYFTSAVRPQLVTGHTYQIKYYLNFQKATAGTVTFSFSNSNAVNFRILNAIVTLVPQGAIAGNTIMSLYARDATTTSAVASPSLISGQGYSAIIDGVVRAVANTRLQLLVTDSAGTITANNGSIFLVTDLGTLQTIGNIG